ncbi:hypothetical protein NLC26_02400 [Candidatus Aminicenantes bacterium AC-708-M15]|jgi:hypothetical protein|nr:hypothetical protein [SCandidatus Aminicenantes bacterium Aminicenantia_JdfR_composite]MCP2597941.1 hypothetical protein [Candidatus Aminicenantes bacterium AC-335-L06]MCP2598979.1 hypothetical protein [Candidatus Aminicenantes bacterium AC-335-B20]MCP2604313.1 hypothetical protein [Candidatus Aminicenantes bacterium AC-708-M15]MCP2606077.1 hypothetical protein [Candidatus Aminicenantes bacterium AC-708-I09]
MKKVLSLGVLILFIFGMSLALPKEKKKKEEKEKIIVPKEVGIVFDEGISTRTPRLDIPVEFTKHFFFPAQQNHVHSVFIFKMKNQDLGFQEIQVQPQKKEEKENAQEEVPIELIADLNVFLRFYKMKDGNIEGIFKEVYIPFQIKKKKEKYNPEEENFYSVGYPLPPGKYLLALAVTSIDLTRIGTVYKEFELPNPLKLKKLILTPIVFLKSYKRLPDVETLPTVHVNSFRYSVLEIVPKLDLSFSKTEQPDVFYFVYGARPNPTTNKYELEVTYQILKGEEAVIKFKPTVFDIPLISHPLPLKKKDKFIEPGEYTLSIKIVDKVSNATLTKKINFTFS